MAEALLRNPLNPNEHWYTKDFVWRRYAPPDESNFMQFFGGVPLLDWPWFFYIRPA